MVKNELIENIITVAELPCYFLDFHITEADLSKSNAPRAILSFFHELYIQFDLPALFKKQAFYTVITSLGVESFLIPGDDKFYLIGPYIKEKQDVEELSINFLNNGILLTEEINAWYHSQPLFSDEKILSIRQLFSKILNINTFLEIHQSDYCSFRGKNLRLFLNHQNEEDNYLKLLNIERTLSTAFFSENIEGLEAATLQYQHYLNNIQTDFELSMLIEQLQVDNALYYRGMCGKTKKILEANAIYHTFKEKIKTVKNISEIKNLQYDLYREYMTAISEASLETYPYYIQEVISYIKGHWAETICLDKLAQRFQINKTYLSHQFKKHVGTGIINYISTVRIKKCKAMLMQTNLSVTEIANMNGFDDANYFTKIFKKTTGMTPVQYRKQPHHQIKSKKTGTAK